MATKIFHTVNSGLYLCENGRGILVDGIHSGQQEGFSNTPPELIAAMLDRRSGFENLSALLFTHNHPDHCDSAVIKQFMFGPLSIPVWGPSQCFRNHPAPVLPEGGERFCIAGFSVLSIATQHDGMLDAAIPHRSYLIEGEEAYFIAGDGVLGRKEGGTIRTELCKPLKAVFLNMYHLMQPENVEFLDLVQPDRIYLIHLPFREDDIYSLRQQTHSKAMQLLPNRPVRIPASMSFL